MRHECRNTNDTWCLCSVCDGRIHLETCTTRRDPKKDCYEVRHKLLHEQGQTVGIGDRSLPMYDLTNQTWA